MLPLPSRSITKKAGCTSPSSWTGKRSRFAYTKISPYKDKGPSPFDALPLRIGQDGTGTYKHRLPAQLDEFILTADVLTEADIAALKAYYR